MSRIRRTPAPAILLTVLLSMSCRPATGGEVARPVTARVPVEQLELENGMTLLLVHRREATTVAAGWMVTAGSADDGPGSRGMSHLIEHMLFKGTRTVGTRDFEREAEVLRRLDRVHAELVTLRHESAAERPGKRSKRARRLRQLEQELSALREEARAHAFLGQFSLLYSELGATGLNANTLRDLTLYFVTLPNEKLEAWFWLESDRLSNPVFREFYKEVGVIREERRLRIESTPTGRQDEALRARFWGRHPYSWDPQGHPQDLDRLGRPDAREFFDRHYRPERITAALIGGFDRQQVATWARTYFGRLGRGRPEPGGEHSPVEIRTTEDRFTASCVCPPQAKVHYPSARFGHADAVALQVLSAVLNGRTGRLYRSLVIDQKLAFSAFTRQVAWRQAGEFAFHAETKGEVDPQVLVSAWDRELERLRAEAVSPSEIRRATNRLAADAFRSLKEPTALMKQLLIYQGLGDWRHINRWPDQVLTITPEDLDRVVSTYLVPTRRVVAIYRRQGRPASKSPGTS